MTVSDTPNRIQYTGNDVADTFSTGTIIFYANTDLVVTERVTATGVETVYTLGVDYTVTGGSGSAGSVVLSAGALASTKTLTIERSLPYAQADDYVEGENILADALETSLDKMVILSQQLRDDSQRSIKFSSTLSSSLDGVIADAPVDGYFLSWDGTSGSIQSVSPADITAITASATFTSLADNDFITYDNGTAKWINETPATVLTTLGITGDIIASDIADFATAAQGTLADSALQAALFPAGMVRGLVPTNNATDAEHDIDFSAGSVVSDNGTIAFAVPAMTKQFDTTWAEGTAAGGMQSGSALPTSGTIHVYAIWNPTTEDADIQAVPQGTAFSAPSGYTVKKRIGSFLTDGSQNLLAFKANEVAGGGLEIIKNVATEDYTTNMTTAGGPYTITLNVPIGIRVIADISAYGVVSSGRGDILYYSADITDAAPSISGAPTPSLIAITGASAGKFSIRTNTSGQIKGDVSNQNLSGHAMTTHGWIDDRV